MSKRSAPFACVDAVDACAVDVASWASEVEPSPKWETASGAMAAPFTKPRLVMFFMVSPHTSPHGNSGFLYDFGNTRSKILEHHRGSIAARTTRNGTARMRCRTRLIEAGDRHTVLGPTGHRAHGATLRCAGAPGVATTMPVVWIHALQIERTFDSVREHFVVR